MGLDMTKNGALEYASHALEIAKETGNQVEEGVAYRELGLIYLASGDLKLARWYLENSLATLFDTENRLELGRSYHGLGLVLIKIDPELACQHLMKAVHIFESQGANIDLQKTHTTLKEISNCP